ncbi:hypothetical protein HX089_16570 [Myroides odoratimimus]|uniref:crAss001_48 related protein n=1 Tax=Myroides odoratimimus TaxID=76832 RepID=UPI00257512CF|nr:hypothetical protein [Myroides odoratimimus]MDM1507506.1 hypothetical protein [Myroides odoratimimus]MDM1517978.1 hypothetical protein [Myroides odoratimimus]
MSDFKTRLENEVKEETEKLGKLKSFLESDKVKDIDSKQQCFLHEQYHYQKGYVRTITKRLNDLNGDTQAVELTLGMKRVGLSFNPTGNVHVHVAKTMQADFIDYAEFLKSTGVDPRCASISQTEAETASMYLVKSNF